MRLLSHDVLTVARRVYDIVDTAMDLRRRGHEAQAWATLTEAHALIRSEAARLEAVISTQSEAAQHLDRAQWTPGGFLPLGERAEKHPHANDDEHGATPEQPLEPAPIGTGL